MEKKIFKYELNDGQTMIKMPIRAEILTVQTKQGKPCLWVLVDPKNVQDFRRFQTYGTGQPIPHFAANPMTYIGTYQDPGQVTVFHLFEYKN